MHFCRLRRHHLDPELFHFLYGMRIPVVQEVKLLGLIFDCKSSFLPHIRYLKNKSTKALNLIRVVAHTSWGTDQDTLLLLYTSLIRSKLDYGCIVYGSAQSTYLHMLDPVQNHALRLCLVLIEPHHHQAFAYLQINLLYTYDAKNSLVYYTSAHLNPAAS